MERKDTEAAVRGERIWRTPSPPGQLSCIASHPKFHPICCLTYSCKCRQLQSQIRTAAASCNSTPKMATLCPCSVGSHFEAEHFVELPKSCTGWPVVHIHLLYLTFSPLGKCYQWKTFPKFKDRKTIPGWVVLLICRSTHTGTRHIKTWTHLCQHTLWCIGDCIPQKLLMTQLEDTLFPPPHY